MSEPARKEGAQVVAAGQAGAAYEDDWVQEQVALLRMGRIDEVDLENVAEELRDAGAEQYDKLESAVEILLAHMLKWDHQPERRSRSWALTIREQRLRIGKLLRKNSGLKPRLDEAVADGYRRGRVWAAREMKRDLDTLPDACPYLPDDILKSPFELNDDR